VLRLQGGRSSIFILYIYYGKFLLTFEDTSSSMEKIPSLALTFQKHEETIPIPAFTFGDIGKRSLRSLSLLRVVRIRGTKLRFNVR
jgi:hypothetical protein